MNQIRKIIQTRVENLVNLAESASEIEHSSSVGNLREEYLISFLKDLVPQSVGITSGFVADAKGDISPQLDLIATHLSSLPLVNMKKGLSLVPIESTLLCAEIKSNLDQSGLSKIEKQNRSILNMNPVVPTKSKFIVPLVILAYDTKLSEDKISDWVGLNPSIFACCVIKKFTIIKDDKIKVFKKDEYDIIHHGTLSFIAAFYKILNFLVELRSQTKPDLDIYLTGRKK